jgi:hypothetical protein
MGYRFLGMISEACKKEYSKNIEEVAKMSAQGLMSENPRIRYEALQSVGLLLNDLKPKLQLKFH